jgi:hypothetical protein
MTLATKSGGLIISGGRIATNCACCWYCLSQCPPDSLLLSVSAEDYIRRIVGVVTSSSGTQRSAGFVSYFPGSQYAGQFVMQRVSSTVYEHVFSQTPPCNSPSFVRFDLASCTLSASFRMLWETDMTNWPGNTTPRAVDELDCNEGNATTAVVFPSSYRFANFTGINATTRATNEGVFVPSPGSDRTRLPLFASASRNCESLYADPPVHVSFTLPIRWWLEASFVGFRISGDFQVGDAPPEVIEQSGSREVSFFISASQNPLP